MATPTSIKINLKQPICTDSPTGADLWEFGDENAKHLQNTGMERDNGITNIYEKETTFASAGTNSLITTQGDLLQVVSGNIVRNGEIIQNVSWFTGAGVTPHCVALQGRGLLPTKYVDAAWTADDTMIGTWYKDGTIYLEEFDPSTETVLHSRTIACALLTINLYVSALRLVRYVDMHYADNQEFLIANNSTPAADKMYSEATLSDTNWWYGFHADYAYRFTTGKYLAARNGTGPVALLNAGWTTIFAAAGTYGTSVSSDESVWVEEDRFGNHASALARIVIAFPIQKVGNQLTGLAWVGYDNAGVFHDSPTYMGPTLAGINCTVSHLSIGPGYSEAKYIRSDLPNEIHSLVCYGVGTGTGAYSDTKTNSYSMSNGLGAILGMDDLYDRSTCDIRVGMIGGIPSFLSVSHVSYPTLRLQGQHVLGVTLTNVGEYDPRFVVNVYDDCVAMTCHILYRYNSRFFWITLQGDGAVTIDKISDRLYRFNIIHPMNMIFDGIPILGCTDFHGSMQYASTAAAPAGTAKLYAAVVRNDAYSSIDTGDVAVDSTATAVPWDYVIPQNPPQRKAYPVDLYLNDVYSMSYTGDAVSYGFDESKRDLAYVELTSILPLPIGGTPGFHSLQTDLTLDFTGIMKPGDTDVNYDYAGYEIGNNVTGSFELFTLFNQLYLFDGNFIYTADFQRQVFSGKTHVCDAYGMQYIAKSSMLIYFLSSFDNSIYTFDGGRTLQKLQRLNRLDTISQGAYNVRDNTLLLEGTNHLYWLRDGILSANDKKAAQTGLSLYDTQDGLIIANNTKSWQYTYLALSGSTVVPLLWQSGYFGLTGNVQQVIQAYIITLYSDTKVAISVMATIDVFDAETTHQQTVPLNLRPVDWTNLGFYRWRIIPEYPRALASALQIECSSRILINDVVVELVPDVSATPVRSS